MNDTTLIIIIIAVTVAVIGGGVFLMNKTGSTVSVTENSAARVVVETTSHDWGNIGINDGDVTATFRISNEGSGPLKLFNVSTSCMCTTAQLKVGEKKSPLFGMHNKSRHVTEVAPQQTAELNVVFDPAYHGPGGIGPVTRQVIMKTNDPERPELTFQVTGNVVR